MALYTNRASGSKYKGGQPSCALASSHPSHSKNHCGGGRSNDRSSAGHGQHSPNYGGNCNSTSGGGGVVLDSHITCLLRGAKTIRLAVTMPLKMKLSSTRHSLPF